MNETDRRYILDIANSFEHHPRLGNKEDVPGGQRYIQISDTMALFIAGTLKMIVGRDVETHNITKQSTLTSNPADKAGSVAGK